MDSTTYYGLLGVSDLKIALDMLEPFLQPSSLKLIAGKKNLILACAHFLYFGYVCSTIIDPDCDEEEGQILNQIFKPTFGQLGLFMDGTLDSIDHLDRESVNEVLRLHRGEITETEKKIVLKKDPRIRSGFLSLDLITLPNGRLGYHTSWFNDLHERDFYKRRSKSLDAIFNDKVVTFRYCVEQLSQFLQTRKPFEYSDDMDAFIESLDQICLQWNREETLIVCEDWEELKFIVSELERMVYEIPMVIEEIRERGAFLCLIDKEEEARICHATSRWFCENGDDIIYTDMFYNGKVERLGFSQDMSFNFDDDEIKPKGPSKAKKHKK